MTATAAPQHKNHDANRHGPPKDETELAELVAAARAELGGAAAAADHLLRTGGEEGLTDGQLARWLAARGWDPARAARDLAAHAEWRAAFCPRGRVLDCEVADDVGQRKALLMGPTESGRSVVVFGKVEFVFIAGGFGWANFDVAGLSMLFRMIHAHYVERLEVLFIHSPSTAFSLLFKVVEPFIDPVTRKKVVLLPRDAAASTARLQRELGAEVLPPCLGGSAEPRPVEAAWALLESLGLPPGAQHRPEQQQQQQQQEEGQGQPTAQQSASDRPQGDAGQLQEAAAAAAAAQQEEQEQEEEEQQRQLAEVGQVAVRR
ncbi:hypothetical protein Rsub_10439 [Raphidocelis subcapitata]|uniref:CRAL-TRIO domain-containing protein n=1 Tax=Raphidocelis subcapitata TaxID=307507 RepID=A0A2V0PCF0_9CHLO|nr:hypothetical protein Rsub_10439 [Raphidocelis subcapitata]|eukprot:GBF97516.1 hypothetical protein Rsub_10439 [Raphidocelis subcapitata]